MEDSGRKPWLGIASISKSVLCEKEPFNTKLLFGRVVARALELLTERLGQVQFVQVGANDGVHADHIHPFVRSGKWRGIMVEPAPEPFRRLIENYKGVEGLRFVQAAVGLNAGRQPFHYVDGEDGLSSFSLETIMSHAPKYDDLSAMIRTIEVETDTLDALCDREGVPHPDVVAVDTEGTDDLVLLSFSLEERKPGLILFEHCHLSAERSAALRDRLQAPGYRLIHDRHDALAIAQDTFDAATTQFFADVVEIARHSRPSEAPR